LGAGVGNIVLLLGKEFLLLVIITLFIAAPVAWYFMNEWLQGFAYRVSMDVWIIILAGLLAVFIAVITVGFQSLKSSLQNPVKNLRGK
jgi:putative ABC transport system permease protein